MSAASGKNVTVSYAVTGGTAVNNRDYALDSGTLVFKPGETAKSIDMRIIDDKIYGDDRTIEVTLSKPVNAVLGSRAVHTYTIVENDPSPLVTFTSPGQEKKEDGGEVTVTVKLSNLSGQDVIVPFTVSGTAVEGKNYGVLTPSPLTIKAGAASGAITLALMDDKLYEENKTVFVTLGTPVNAIVGAYAVHRVTIVESDPPPLVDFLSKESARDEGTTPRSSTYR